MRLEHRLLALEIIPAPLEYRSIHDGPICPASSTRCSAMLSYDCPLEQMIIRTIPSADTKAQACAAEPQPLSANTFLMQGSICRPVLYTRVRILTSHPHGAGLSCPHHRLLPSHNPPKNLSPAPFPPLHFGPSAPTSDIPLIPCCPTNLSPPTILTTPHLIILGSIAMAFRTLAWTSGEESKRRTK